MSWQLFHYALFHTFPHYDAVGLCTFVQVVNGYKFWIFVRSPDLASASTPEKYLKAMSSVTEGGVKFQGGLERYVVYAGPGDIL